MIIYLHGPDSLRRGRKLREFTASYRGKNKEIDFASLDFEEEPEAYLKAKEFLAQPSLFVSSKLLIVRESRNALDEKAWLKILKSEIDTKTSFVMISDSEKPIKAMSFLLTKPVQSQEFPELSGEKLKSFVLTEAKDQKVSFSEGALNYFLQFLLSSSDKSWRAHTELKKISSSGFEMPLALVDLKEIISLQGNTQVYEYLRGFSWKRQQERLAVLEELFLRKEAGAYIFNSLGFQARGEEALRLSEYDIAVKSGKLEYEEALLDLAIGNS
jgi:hypothetical protein